MWQVLSNREKKSMEEEKEKLSGTLMVALPDLISKVNILARWIKPEITSFCSRWSVSSVGRASC